MSAKGNLDVINCKCVCKRNEGGECDCICNAPCPGTSEGKTMSWTCNCGSRGKNCVCKFQLRCTREDGQGCCGGETELYTCDCACGSGECSFRVRKCICCEITRTECGGCSGNEDVVEQQDSCCGRGGCCKN